MILRPLHAVLGLMSRGPILQLLVMAEAFFFTVLITRLIDVDTRAVLTTLLVLAPITQIVTSMRIAGIDLHLAELSVSPRAILTRVLGSVFPFQAIAIPLVILYLYRVFDTGHYSLALTGLFFLCFTLETVFRDFAQVIAGVQEVLKISLFTKLAFLLLTLALSIWPGLSLDTVLWILIAEQAVLVIVYMIKTHAPRLEVTVAALINPAARMETMARTSLRATLYSITIILTFRSPILLMGVLSTPANVAQLGVAMVFSNLMISFSNYFNKRNKVATIRGEALRTPMSAAYALLTAIGLALLFTVFYLSPMNWTALIFGERYALANDFLPFTLVSGAIFGIGVSFAGSVVARTRYGAKFLGALLFVLCFQAVALALIVPEPIAIGICLLCTSVFFTLVNLIFYRGEVRKHHLTIRDVRRG